MSQFVVLAAAGGTKGSRSYVSAAFPIEYTNDRRNALAFMVLDGEVDIAVAAARAIVAGESRPHELLLVTNEVVSLISE